MERHEASTHPSQDNVQHYLTSNQLFPSSNEREHGRTGSLIKTWREADKQIENEKNRFRYGVSSSSKQRLEISAFGRTISSNRISGGRDSFKGQSTGNVPISDMFLTNFNGMGNRKRSNIKGEGTLKSSRVFESQRNGSEGILKQKGLIKGIRMTNKQTQLADIRVRNKKEQLASLKLYSIKREFFKIDPEDNQTTGDQEKGTSPNKASKRQDFKLRDISQKNTNDNHQAEILENLSSRRRLKEGDNNIGMGGVQYKPKKGIQLSNLSPEALMSPFDEEFHKRRCEENITKYFKEKTIGGNPMDNARLKRYKILRNNQLATLQEITRRKKEELSKNNAKNSEFPKFIPNDELKYLVDIEKDKVITQRKLANEVFTNLKRDMAANNLNN